MLIFYEGFQLLVLLLFSMKHSYLLTAKTLSDVKQLYPMQNRKQKTVRFSDVCRGERGFIGKNGLIGNFRDVAYFNSTLEYKIIYPTGKSDHTKNDNFGGVQIIFLNH